MVRRPAITAVAREGLAWPASVCGAAAADATAAQWSSSPGAGLPPHIEDSAVRSSMTFVKICGIQTHDEAHAAFACGAMALGFLVGLTHRADDQIDAATARSIVGRLPTGTEAVLVTHLLDPDRVADLAAAVGARARSTDGNVA
jgi:hypothetical protein